MKALLDTNILIHREAGKAVNPDIGVLFKWLDTLHIQKCVHPITIAEIKKHRDPRIVETFAIKLLNYHALQTQAPLHPALAPIVASDNTENDRNDTLLLNELASGRVDIFISEDRNIHKKALALGVQGKVFTIDSFLERAIAANPTLKDYKVLAVKRELMGNVRLEDDFFLSFKRDYVGFDKWFNSKAEEPVYICQVDGKLLAFLYLKSEKEDENYSNILPAFPRKKRLKIGTFKVVYNGYKIGERFLKIIFDNAIRFKVDEIYVTIFNKDDEQKRLSALFERFGFKHWGYKDSPSGREYVYVRDFSRHVSQDRPRDTFPYVSGQGNAFLVPIYPAYHTNLLPDSILNTESPHEFTENEPFRNAIRKAYICRSIERGLKSGDAIVFYRTGGYYEGVITTIGIVESVITDIGSESEFIELCKKRSVFTGKELSEQWNFKKYNKPFIVNFLYAYSFPKRINLKELIRLGIIADIESVPRGFTKISKDQFKLIVKETKTDESIIVY